MSSDFGPSDSAKKLGKTRCLNADFATFLTSSHDTFGLPSSNARLYPPELMPEHHGNLLPI